MRFSVELELENNVLQKDKNRCVLSLLKTAFSDSNKEFFEEVYEDNVNFRKDFTFSMYLGKCIFKEETIELEYPKVILNFSTYDDYEGINFYNGFVGLKNSFRKVKFGRDNNVVVKKIVKQREEIIKKDEVVFVTKSPIIVREHNHDNKSTYYHSLSKADGVDILTNIAKNVLRDKFQNEVGDIENLKIELVSQNKEVKIKNYGIVLLGNICTLKVCGRNYLLDYIYKAGVGSKCNSGFGMVDVQ